MAGSDRPSFIRTAGHAGTPQREKIYLDRKQLGTKPPKFFKKLKRKKSWIPQSQECTREHIESKNNIHEYIQMPLIISLSLLSSLPFLPSATSQLIKTFKIASMEFHGIVLTVDVMQSSGYVQRLLDQGPHFNPVTNIEVAGDLHYTRMEEVEG